jgi:RNase adaptor protein for sRNA GlmZ degradation
MGLASRVDALRRLHPEIESDEEAIDRLLRVQEIEQILLAGLQPKAEKQIDTSEG